MTAYKIANVAICYNFIRHDLSWNWISNLVVRLAIWTLGNWKPKNSWHALTVSTLLVLNNFIKESVNDKIKRGNLMLVKHTGFQRFNGASQSKSYY